MCGHQPNIKLLKTHVKWHATCALGDLLGHAFKQHQAQPAWWPISPASMISRGLGKEGRQPACTCCIQPVTPANWIGVTGVLSYLRFAESRTSGLAPYRSSSSRHSAWPPLAASIRGVTPLMSCQLNRACSTVQYSVVQYSQYNTVQCNTVPDTRHGHP